MNTAGRLWELDADTGDVIDYDVLTAGSGIYGGLAVLGGQVYVLDSGASDIIEFNPVTDEVTGTLDVDGINGIWIEGGLAGITGPDALLASDAVGEVDQIDPTSGIIAHQFASDASGPDLAVVAGNIYVSPSYLGGPAIYSREGTLLGVLTVPYPVAALGGDDVASIAATGRLFTLVLRNGLGHRGAGPVDRPPS